MAAVIETHQLTKRFRDVLAVDRIDLQINERECFGLLGPNGAGKTSLIRMITGVSPPSSGEVRVLGKNYAGHAPEIKKELGVVSQWDNLDPDLRVLQNLITFSRYFDIPTRESRRRAEEVLELFELTAKAHSKVIELSGGMKRRLIIARSLLNRPRLLILDEPTTGLDPQSKHLVWRKLQEFRNGGMTELLCTQNMEEAQFLCDRVAIMNQGKFFALDTPANLISQFTGNEVWEIGAQPENKVRILEVIKKLNLEFEETEDTIHVFHTDSRLSAQVLEGLAYSVTRRPATLEDVFFRITGRSLGE